MHSGEATGYLGRIHCRKVPFSRGPFTFVHCRKISHPVAQPSQLPHPKGLGGEGAALGPGQPGGERVLTVRGVWGIGLG
jgi:hypothetical protein